MKVLNKNMSMGTSVWAELRRGKSIGRALLNAELSRLLPTLTGTALDLGGGSGSYLRFKTDTLQITRTDYKGEDLDAIIDFNEKLPYPNDSFDTVLFLNALYIANEPQAVLDEVLRILRPGGRLILSTPYLMAEMRQPHDYYRFTSEWLEGTLKKLGYADIQLIPIGERFTAIANLVDGFGTRAGKLVSYSLASLADRLFPRKIQMIHPAPIVYLVIARVPE